MRRPPRGVNRRVAGVRRRAAILACVEVPTLLHLDDALIVVDKPAGLLAVPGRGPEKADCAAARVQARWPGALVVHRLDMATSGLLVFARTLAAQQALGRAFAAREVDKRYVAVVDGVVETDAGTIDLPLAADWPNRPLQKVDRERGRPSLTHWKVLERDLRQRRTRLLLQPVTGRSHQLRVHLREIGHPIVGDALYGPSPATRGPGRLLLHAAQLAFAHPADGRACRFEARLPF